MSYPLYVPFVLMLILTGCGIEPQVTTAPAPDRTTALTEATDLSSSTAAITTATRKPSTKVTSELTLTPQQTSTRIPTSTIPPTPAPPSNLATQRLSVSVEGLPTHQSAWQAAISADGRYVVHTYGWPDPLQVILHDLKAGTMTLVSAAPDGMPGDGLSLYPAISADGSTIAFTSTASNLVENPYTDCLDVDRPWRQYCFAVYIYQVATGQLERIARGSRAVLSAEGRYVAFSGAREATSGSFIYDRSTGTLTPIGPDGVDVADISADGNIIALVSAQNQLVPGDTNDAADVFVLDRTTGQLARISTPIDGVERGGQSGIYLAAPSGALTFGGSVAISSDGRYVVFGSTMPNLVEVDLPTCSGFVLNSMEAYQGPCPQYYLHDRETKQTELVSLTTDGMPANGNSFGNGDVSADGRFVVFTSTARNLWPEPPPNCTSFIRSPCVQIFVRDRERGRTYLAGEGWGSRASHHAGGVITPDGHFVASWLEADVLTSPQQNEMWDILVTDLLKMIGEE